MDQQPSAVASLMGKQYAQPGELTTSDEVYGAYNDACQDIGQYRRALCESEVTYSNWNFDFVC